VPARHEDVVYTAVLIKSNVAAVKPKVEFFKIFIFDSHILTILHVSIKFTIWKIGRNWHKLM